MVIADCRSLSRNGGILLTALTLCFVGSVQPASAQNLFESLFGGGFRRHAPEPMPRANAFADPFGMFGGEPRRPSADAGFGHGTVYCVRTCDGRYFPLQRHAGANPAELCKSFCPAAKTMVFSGSKIDTAVAPNGTRYADLDNAFAYRDKVSDSCSCNGKDGLGLARVESSGDPTLRPGDIVATDDGLATYTAAGTGPRNSRRSARRRANGRAAFPRSRCGRRRQARRSSRWPMTMPSPRARVALRRQGY